MKLVKYLALALALCAFASESKAQTVQFLGGGSSALFLELGQAAVGLNGGTSACVWTSGSNGNILARDNRTATPTDEQGSIWIVWSAGSGSCAVPAGTWNIYSYMSLDSVLGDRCYFEVDSSTIPGCVQVLTVAAGTAGGNKLCYPSASTCTSFGDTTGGIPAPVIGALNGQHWFVAGTDIRPEDAKYATYRALAPCGQLITRQAFDLGLHYIQGLGYQTATTGVGVDIKSDFSTASFHVLDFNISGNDPINTTAAVPSFTVSTVGAQPIVVSVAPAGGTGIGAATDVPLATLMYFYDGTLGRATDLLGPTAANSVTTLVREPLSGTYNTFEYSAVNNNQFHESQDGANCNGNVVANNPMHNGSPAAGGTALRRRVIGTGQMVAQLQAATAADNRLGYFFWSAGNASAFTATNGKYLTVNGVDPLTNGYTDGVFPGVDASHPLTNVSFKYLNQGDYPIWSALRLVSKSPTPAGVTNLISAAQTLNTTQFDFITLANLKVWHSHYYLNAVNVNFAANGATLNSSGDLCGTAGALAENGGDVGGSNILKVNNADFCSDFGSTSGLILRVN